MADTPSVLFATETDTEIYTRLLADLGNPPGSDLPWNTRPGSVVHAILQPILLERKRILDYAEFIVQLGFLQYSIGSYLDAKALEFGVTRSLAVPAEVTLTFEGVVGSSIGSGTIVSTEGNAAANDAGVTFVTTDDVVVDVTGTVDVHARAETGGVAGNVGVHELVVLVTAVSGITGVTNDVPAGGGVDAENDDALREKALARARSLPFGGNKSTYFIMALQEPEVGTAFINDLWRGPGTGQVVIGGISNPWVSPVTVDRLQSRIDPTVKILSHFEDENWVGGTEITSGPLEGRASRSLVAVNPAVADMNWDVGYALGAWDSSTDEIWLDLRRVSASDTLTSLRIRFYAPGGTSVAYTSTTVSAATINAVTDIGLTGGGLLVVARSAFTNVDGTAVFTWNNIGGIAFELIAASGKTAELWLDGLRIVRKQGGFDTGEALIGTQLTVRSARSLEINVAANLTVDPSLTLVEITADISSSLITLLDLKTPGSVLRVSEVANAIHDTIGVIDYSDLIINGSSINVQLGSDQRPVIGTLTFTLV